MTHTPFGYKVVNAEAVIDESISEKIRQLYREYLSCGSMSAAARKVGINKTHSVIGRILRNVNYLGNDYYPQIVDEELFNKVQELRKNNAKSQNRIRDFKEPESVILKNYKLGKVEEKYTDPYKQAEYAYSIIEEENDE